MRTHTRPIQTLAGLLLAAGLAAGHTASAQEPDARVLSDIQLQPGQRMTVISTPEVTTSSQQGQTQAAIRTPIGQTSTMVITQRNADGTVYRVEIVNDSVSASINGEPVPGDRIERRGDDLILRDADGRELVRFGVGMEQAETNQARTRTGWVINPQPARVVGVPGAVGGGGQGGVAAPVGVVLGIRTQEPTPEMLENLPPGAGEAVYVVSVEPGTAAADAGLVAGDVILTLDGKSPGGVQGLRTMLREREAGDQVVLRVIRQGRPLETTATLRAARVNLPARGMDDAAERLWIEIEREGFERGRARAEELIRQAVEDGKLRGEEAIARLHAQNERIHEMFQHQLQDPEARARAIQRGAEVLERARQGLPVEELLAHVERLESMVLEGAVDRELLDRLRQQAEHLRGEALRQPLLFRPAAPGFPTAPAAPPAPPSPRVGELEARLDAMEQRLQRMERLEQRLESAMERMERILDRLDR